MPIRFWRRRCCVAAVFLGSICFAPGSLLAQDRVDFTLSAGRADRAGLVGHGGVRFAPRALGSWEAYRLDVTIGRRAGYTLGAATASLELGPPATRTGGVRLYALLGYGALWTDDAFGSGAMAGAGARVPIGQVWIVAEQRFQPAFSPFLVGVSF